MIPLTLEYRSPIEALKQYYVIAKDIEIILSEVMPKSELDMHHHIEAQIGIGIGGRLNFAIENGMYNLERETAYIVGSNVWHGGTNEFGESFIGIDIKMPNSMIQHSKFDIESTTIVEPGHKTKVYKLDSTSVYICWVKTDIVHMASKSGYYIYLSGVHSVFNTKKIFRYENNHMINIDNQRLEYIYIGMEI